jgi:hypothetical protein
MLRGALDDRLLAFPAALAQTSVARPKLAVESVKRAKKALEAGAGVARQSKCR